MLARDLRRIVPDGHVLEDAGCRSYAIQGMVPPLVVRPASIEDVSAVLRIAHAAHVAVAPWGGGARQYLGFPPRRLDLVVSLERLRRSLIYRPDDLTISLEAGMRFDELARLLAPARQMLPLDPALPATSTIGGIVATNSNGPRRLLYGSCRDVLIGMTVVQADGTVSHSGGMVVKNVSGYDMHKLHLGALGTLGIVVTTNFKLLPLPAMEQTVLFENCALAQASDLSRRLILSPLGIASITVQCKGHHGDDRLRLAIRCEGRSPVVARQVRDVQALATRSGLPSPSILEGDEHTALWDDIVASGHGALGDAREAVISVSVLPSRVEETLSELARLASIGGLSLLWVAHMATGLVTLRVHPSTDAWPESLRTFQQACLSRWPRTLVVNCPPEIKAGIAVWGAPPSGISIMRRIKHEFDPHDILNPGRFLVSS